MWKKLIVIFCYRKSRYNVAKNGYARERMLLLSIGGLNAVLALPQIHCSDWLRRRTLSIVAYLVLPQNKPAQFPVLCDGKKQTLGDHRTTITCCR